MHLNFEPIDSWKIGVSDPQALSAIKGYAFKIVSTSQLKKGTLGEAINLANPPQERDSPRSI
jgi:hypothetical protein